MNKKFTGEKGLTICLWFESGAEKAAKFYAGIFNGIENHNGTLAGEAKQGESTAKASDLAEGSVLTALFELDGQRFLGLNGGPNPALKFSGATSFMINCKTQKEVDYFWEKLGGDGAETGQCGWINHDKFGITWQIVPEMMGDLMSSDDREAAERTAKAMMSMTKLDIAKLKAAFEGK